MTSQAADAYTGTDNLEVMKEAVNYNRFLADLVCKSAPAEHVHTAIDFGAGVGTFSGVLGARAQRLVCVEADSQLQDMLRRGGHEVAALEALDDDSVDYAFSLNVFEHIDADVEAARALRCKLRPGGRLFVYVPALLMLWTSMDDKVRHCRRYTRAGLRRMLHGAGFEVESVRYADCAGFLATLAYKAVGARDGSIDRAKLVLFDRYAFPLGRVLDRLGAQHLVGKNVYALARRPLE